MKLVEIWTDGACSGNPGPGGWAAILRFGSAIKELCGSSAGITTNNQMEITAVKHGLAALKESCQVKVYTDSQLVCGWLSDSPWKCKTSAIRAIRDEIRALIAEKGHQVEYIFTPGHMGDEMNERCDVLATGSIRRPSF